MISKSKMDRPSRPLHASSLSVASNNSSTNSGGIIRYYPDGGFATNNSNKETGSVFSETAKPFIQDGTTELITNLDHELWDVRLRALKCIMRKLDCGILSSETLSRRADLLNRLCAWIRQARKTINTRPTGGSPTSLNPAREGLPFVIQLLILLAEHENTRQFIQKEKIDSLLSNLRLQLNGETRALLDKLLDAVATVSIDLTFKGQPELWDDNESIHPSDQIDLRKNVLSQVIDQYHYQVTEMSSGRGDEFGKHGSVDNNSAWETYFPEESKDSHDLKLISFGVSSVPLGGIDRRVLASTVESLLSKNEPLVLMTVSFLRDVLVQDYPPEVFIQESALVMSVLEVAESSWENPMISYVSVQGLLRLSNVLRMRISQLNSSEFYEMSLDSQKSNMDGSSSYSPYKPFGIGTSRGRKSTTSNSETLASNICSFLKSVTRTLLFKPDMFSLWILLDSFSFTLCKFSLTFPLDSTSFSLSLQEILQDLAHCYEKNHQLLSSPALALCVSSIFHSLHKTEPSFIIAQDVRKTLRELVCCPKLFHLWPEVYHYFLETAAPLDDTLKGASERMELVCKGLEEMANVLDVKENAEMDRDTFNSLKEAVPFLDMCESEDSVEAFLTRTLALFTNPIYHSLIPSDEERNEVILQLMAHSSEGVRAKIYSRLRILVKKHFGPESIPSGMKSIENEIALSIIIDKEFLQEVLNFGTMDSNSEVQHFAEEIVLFLMKSKLCVREEIWDQVLSLLSTCQESLECQADVQTVIGKAVLSFCDPGTNENELNETELLCSNLRLLYSSNLRVREEASERMMKMLSQTPSGTVTFRYASYSNYTLSSMFSVGRNLDPTEEPVMTTNGDGPVQKGGLLRQVEACRSEDLESNVKKQALFQLSVLLEDQRLHAHFCENGGPELILEIVGKIASEKDYKYSLDMWPPAVKILKLITLPSGSNLRKRLGKDFDLLVNLSCGLFSLRADDRFRADAIHLLTLLLFPSVLKYTDSGRKMLLPHILLMKYRIPIVAEPYLKVSAYRTEKKPKQLAEDVATTLSSGTVGDVRLDNYPMDRVYTSWWTLGRKQPWGDFIVDSSSRILPEDSIQGNGTSISHNSNKSHPQEVIRELLHAVQNAAGHGAVIETLDILWTYILPLELNARMGTSQLDYICSEAPWREAFYRFMVVEPTCPEDEELLTRILDILTFLILNMKEASSVLEWVVSLSMEKGCAALKLLKLHAVGGSETPYSATVLPTVLRSLLEFYFGILKSSHLTLEDEYLWDLFSTICHVFHELGQRNFNFAVVLQPILYGLSLLTSKASIRDQLVKNPKFVLALFHRVTEVIIFLKGTNPNMGDSFKHQGALCHASLSLFHVVSLINADRKGNLGFESIDWIGKCCAVIPSLWDSRDVKTKSLAFQLCQLITSSSKGCISCMQIMESPATVWIKSYNTLMDCEESAVVKNRAGTVLLNLLSTWDEVSSCGVINEPLSLPDWPVLDDLVQLLSHVYWLPCLSDTFKETEEAKPNNSGSGESQSSAIVHLITPKGLGTICKLLIQMSKSKLLPFHPEPFNVIVSSSGICPLLFRIVGTHCISSIKAPAWWFDSLRAISSTVESLISMAQLDRSICVMLISDKRSVYCLIQLFTLEALEGERATDILSSLLINVFTLLSILCSESGNNFEDLERCIFSQRELIFGQLVQWLKSCSLAKCRKIALQFTYALLSRLTYKQQDREASKSSSFLSVSSGGQGQSPHPLLCREWKEMGGTLGGILCRSLLEVYEDVLSVDERKALLSSLCALISLSPTAKEYGIEYDLAGCLIDKLKEFGLRYYDSTDTGQIGRKSVNQWHEETLGIMSVLSALVYQTLEAKKSAHFNNLVDTLHKIFKWWKSYPNRTLLHAFIETLMNFTEDFTVGSQALTMTSNAVGVGPRKVPTPQSLLVEIIYILQMELDSIDKNPNLKTIELIFELLKNTSFVVECRNLIIKSTIIPFLKNLYPLDVKKWSAKQQQVKAMYLEFIVDLSIHSDMQAAIAKVPEAIEVLVLLVDLEQESTSILALKILRNLSFQPCNRARFLCDESILPALSIKLRDSDNLEVIEIAAVSVWTLIANSEKGKLVAKKSNCHTNVSKAMRRLRKVETSSNDIYSVKRDLSNVLKILTTLLSLLGCSTVNESCG